MKTILKVLLLWVAFSLTVWSADLTVGAVKGDVYVRHNVQEQWVRVARGDVLKPDDSMKSGKNSSATIIIEGTGKVLVPESVIIDLSDLRILPQDDFLLKLAMEQVRSLPPRPRDDQFILPRTTTVHGSLKDERPAPEIVDPAIPVMQLRGTEVLYKNNFFATCVLKAKEILRRHEDLRLRIDDRLMIASALEQLKLSGESRDEYISLNKEQLPAAQRAFVAAKIEQLSERGGK